MSTISQQKGAVPSALGYYYQGPYALVVLSEASDNASVSVETDDDVVLNDSVASLFQLKHSLAAKADLSIKDVGFWKAIHNWCSRPHDGTEHFIFVTRAPVTDNSPLQPLLVEGTDRADMIKALVAEASRVRDERDAVLTKAPPNSDPKLPHKERANGCAALLALAPKRQEQMFRYARILPDGFTAADVPDLLANSVGKFFLPKFRPLIIERLIEWWDRQVVLSLMNKRPRNILRQEMLVTLNRFVLEHGEENLPDDFSLLKPGNIRDGIGRFMEKQIEWINGGQERLNRAAVARWRARGQRDKWMKKDITNAAELDRYDERLIESWMDRFGPKKHDCKPDEASRCQMGIDLIDWSHYHSPNEIVPIRPLWTQHYIVQGTYQQLAEEGRVGWHPDFEEKLNAMKENT